MNRNSSTCSQMKKILTQTVENKTDIFNHKNEKARILDLSMDRSGLHTVIKLNLSLPLILLPNIFAFIF